MKPNCLALSALGRRTAAPPISWLMKAALARPQLISLAAGFTDPATLPVSETRLLARQILKSGAPGRAALQYGTTAGEERLRRLTAERVRRLDGAPPAGAYSAERVVITHGSQQLLYMATEALCDPGDVVLVEDPTYFVYLGILQSHGVRGCGVRLEGDGLDLGHLEAVLNRLKRQGELPRLKLLYLVTYHQNPTGTTTSLEKKRGALRLLRQFESAAGHPIYLLEDAAYRELGFRGQAPPSALASRGAASRVLYAGTYSKPFATGVRVGFGLLPEPVRTAVLRIKGNHDFGTSNLPQHLLAAALESGIYDRHLDVLHRRYARKAQIMQHALAQEFPPQAEWRPPAGGLYFWVRLPGRIGTGVASRLFKAAVAHDVLYVPGQLCYAPDPARRRPDHEMRLSFGAASEHEIREGITRLGSVLQQELDSRDSRAAKRA
ncbi:MAG TPA: PLP-dependent aminotransferase family protein [Verrucomicrobiota bacterium]|nr:PLP-dependent aminotransferase family protein [Verrucomicrobiota bacterium]HRT09789.1 PLP-dependent aminotransferase family protein [Candidatus Paceibacterota bacterium]